MLAMKLNNGKREPRLAHLSRVCEGPSEFDLRVNVTWFTFAISPPVTVVPSNPPSCGINVRMETPLGTSSGERDDEENESGTGAPSGGVRQHDLENERASCEGAPDHYQCRSESA